MGEKSWSERVLDTVFMSKGGLTPHAKYAYQMGDSDIMCHTPPGLKVQLLDNQRTLLAALLDYESHTTITKVVHQMTFNIKYNCVRLSEIPGSGKTIVIIALVVLKQEPKPRPIINNIEDAYTKNAHQYITRIFPPHRVLPCTVVIVPRSVFGQWNMEISKFSNLKVLQIVDVKALRRLYNMIDIDLDELRTYDIILVKIGTISGPCPSSYIEPINRNRDTISLYNKFSELVRPYAFWRVVYDDIDMAKMPTLFGRINSYSTIAVSATSKYHKKSSRIAPYDSACSIWETCRYPYTTLSNIVHDPFINAAQIKNSDEFVARSLQRVKIHFKLRVVSNKHNMLFNMIGTMIPPELSRQILEALNGDALDAASDLLGIKSKSPSDIFRKLLGDKFNERDKYNSTLRFIETIDLNHIDTLDPPPQGEVYHKKHFYEKKPIDYNYDNFEDRMNQVWDDCTDGLKETSTVIDRFQLKLCEGICGICTDGLNNKDIVIMNCCGQPFHNTCAFASSHIRKDFTGRMTALCPHCKVTMDPRLAFTSVSNANLVDIIEFDDTAEVEEKECKEEKEEKEDDPTKMDHMVDIINGTNRYPTQDTPADYDVAGFVDMPTRPSAEQQTIIFTRFEQSIKKICERLTDDGINYAVYGGHINHMSTALAGFNNGSIKVLVINGEKNASGITLSAADNLIFMHHINDVAIARQIVGRIDRYGRKYAGYVYRINYENEVPPHYLQ